MIAASPVPALMAAVMQARRKIAGHFFVHHAVSAEDAVAYVPQRPIMRSQFQHLLSRGVIRDAGGGRYWLDTAAYQTDIERRRRIMVAVVIVLVVALAFAIMLLGYKG